MAFLEQFFCSNCTKIQTPATIAKVKDGEVARCPRCLEPLRSKERGDELDWRAACDRAEEILKAQKERRWPPKVAAGVAHVGRDALPAAALTASMQREVRHSPITVTRAAPAAFKGVLGAQELEKKALELLRLSLGSPTAEFREGQLEAIDALVRDRKRLLVVQPTGWGKSAVYFIATHLLAEAGLGVTLIVSPLLSLMRNQLQAAKRMGLVARRIDSSNKKVVPQVIRELQNDKVDLLYITPERLGDQEFVANVLATLHKPVGMLVIDEAHCISDWGHDFRPDYRRISRILKMLPANVPLLATTATASSRVVEDVVAQIGGLEVQRGGLARKSLALQAIKIGGQAERLAWLEQAVPKLKGTGIIYVRTVKDAVAVAAFLRESEMEVEPYYGSLDDLQRERLEQQLLDNEVKALVATSALGMGFDKPDLGFVIHFQRPGSLVEYYQQVGRAGRGITEAYGFLLAGDEDDAITDYFIYTAFPPKNDILGVLRALGNSDDGLTFREIQERVNISAGQLGKVLKMLELEATSPIASSIVERRKVYSRTIQPYTRHQKKIDALIALRQDERDDVNRYVEGEHCYMQYLRQALDDATAEPCGKCAICLGRSLLAFQVPDRFVASAQYFIAHSYHAIQARKKFPNGANIPRQCQAEEGRALCRYGDGVYGAQVQRGKYHDAHFADELVEAVAEMLQEWQPYPQPQAICYVPSLRHLGLVRSFAERLAARLGLPLLDCVDKVKETQPQKEMYNSAQQYQNLEGAFAVTQDLSGQSLLLLDDMVDSGWTFTHVAKALRQQGARAVFPVALAVTSAQ